MCRRLSGSYNMPFGAFPKEYVQFDGTEQLRRTRGSEVAERLFCGECGSQVGMDYRVEPSTLWLTLGLGRYSTMLTLFLVDVTIKNDPSYHVGFKIILTLHWDFIVECASSGNRG